jgi:hypothetical protein
MRRTLYVLLAAFLATCLQPPPKAQQPPRAAEEEKAVCEAAIEDVVQHAGPGRSAQVAIRSTTATGRRPGTDEAADTETELKKLVDDISRNTTPPLDRALRASYVAQNRMSQPFPTSLKLSVPSVTEAFDLSSKDFWSQFYKKHPGSAGIIVLSRVGFNDTYTRALIYREHLYANRGMNGVYLLLTRDANGWHIEKTIPSWIA